MNKDKYLEDIDNFIMKEKYEELSSYTISYFKDKKIDEILNIIKFKELLLNKESSIKKKTKLIEPLKRYLMNKNLEIDYYVECCNLINDEYRRIHDYREMQLKELFKYDVNIVLMNILSKTENYNHKIIRNSCVEDNNIIYNMNTRSNSMNEYQSTIEGLGLFIKDILGCKEEFKHIEVWSNKEQFRSSLKRCNKKTFKNEEIILYLNSIVNLDFITKKIQEYSFKPVKIGNEVFFEYLNIEAYKKKAIAGERCDIYDHNHFLEYTYNGENSKLSELEKKFECVDWNNLIEYDNSHNHFVLKFTLFSDELISIMIESFKEFKFQKDEMKGNAFISDEVFNKITGEDLNFNITYNDAIDFYFILKIISLTYYKAVIHYYKKLNKDPSLPFLGLTIEVFYKIIKPLYSKLFKEEIKKSKIEELIKLYTFSENNIFDLYYKPIIRIKDKIMIIPSVIERNNFNRTFINHMSQIGANFKEGILFEAYLKDVFKKYGFIVYDKDSPRLNFDMGNDKKGDIDLLMMKGKYIFYSQIKNRANPIESRDYIAFDRKINKKAIKQLNYAKDFLKSNPKYITEFFNVSDLNQYEFIPFIMTNSFYASGDKRKGVYITDTSAILFYLEKGKIQIRNSDGKIVYEKNLKTENIEEGLILQLKEPHFKDEKLYYNLYFPRAYYIGDKLFVLKVKDELIDKHLKSSYFKDDVKDAFLSI